MYVCDILLIMESGEAPQPTKLETARNIALEKGGERRQKVVQRIGGFFSGIKEKITRGVDFVLGFPDAAVYLGMEAVKSGKGKAAEVIDAVIEAGKRAWESTMDTSDRLVQRGRDVKNRLVARYEQTRDAVKAKVVDLSKGAAIWGLTNVADPIETRLQRIWEIPANIREWQAGQQVRRAERQERRARLARETGEAKVRALQEEIARIQEATRKTVEAMTTARDAALTTASELYEKAATRRERVRRKFGRAREAVRGLQTR